MLPVIPDGNEEFDAKAWGAKLRHFREAAGLRLSDVALHLGVHPAAPARWEAGFIDELRRNVRQQEQLAELFAHHLRKKD